MIRRELSGMVRLLLCTLFLVLAGCSEATQTVPESQDTPAASSGVTPDIVERGSPVPTEGSMMTTEENRALADVISVQVTGNAGAYQFSVGISSPDTGCDQYADWWEVVSEQGELIYRRILLHSHVDEQPFVRSGGSVEIAADTTVWVRAHMNEGGYGGDAFRGSVQDGFTQAEMDPEFARELESAPPLPEDCAF